VAAAGIIGFGAGIAVASPAGAGAAFFEAAKSGGQLHCWRFFGADSKSVLFSGDAVKDKEYL
jgi:hypothetical protein